MEPEGTLEDPTGQPDWLTESNQRQKGYWDAEYSRLRKEQEDGIIDPNLIDPETGLITTDSPDQNQYFRQLEEYEAQQPDIVQSAQQVAEEKAYYDTGKQHKLAIDHPKAEELKAHIKFDPKELNPDHPNYEAIYGQTPTFSWGQALLGPLFVGAADDKAELYRNRKHLFTSGSGEADLATNLQEVSNTMQGAAYQVVDGVLRLPETTGRILGGQNPFDKNFELSWDPLASIGIEEPWTGTKFGDAGKVIGSFSVGGAGAAGLLGKLSKVNKLGKVASWYRGLNNTHKIMISEALYMQASNYRTDPGLANFLNESTFIGDVPVLKEALGLIAVGDNDHPAVKQLKNTLEAAGMVGVGAKIFGALSPEKLTPAGKAGSKLVTGLDPEGATELTRILANQADQSIEMGRAQLAFEATEFKAPGLPRNRFRADKNRPVASSYQGARISTNSAGKIYQQLNRLDDLGLGSTDSILSARDSELGAAFAEFTPKKLKQIATELLGDPYVQGLMRDAEAAGLKFEDAFAPAFRRFQEVLGGEASKLSPEEYWGPIFKGADRETLETIVASDLVNQALFKEIRDLSVVGREMNKVADIFATDSIAKPIAEKLVFGLTNVKRSRFLLTPEFRQLTGKQAATALAERTALLHDETVDGVRLMMQFLRNSDSDELATGILEVFSMSDKIKNFKDFDAWMRQKLIGGEFANQTRKGVMLKELGAVMSNSILSGPKTPLRAIIGTTSNAYLNELATLFGATIRRPFTGDVVAFRSSAASAHAMFELIPDAWKIFRANLNANFTGDLANIKTRFSSYNRGDANFDLMGQWAERHGTLGDKAAFYIANNARLANNNKLFTWSSRVLGATDDTFRWLLSKARARKKAIEKVMAEGGENVEINPRMLRKAEDIEFNRLHDAEGNLDITKDAFLEKNFKEVTLTTELRGFTKGLNDLMTRYPLTKPFFLFARTGINGLRMSVKNLPIVGAVVDESRAILGSTEQMVKEGHLLKYGIESISDLKAAKDLIIGRQAISTLVVYGVSQKYMAGQLTGNGPADQSMKKMWIDSGWQPRSIKIGDAWVSYDSFEPFNLVMANIADIGDNMQLMGEDFSEERIQLVVAALGKGVTSKTYLQGLGQLFDVIGGNTGYNASRVAANLVNNQFPLAGMRNEIGKVLNPGMRELSSNFWDHIANRNPILKSGLPVKYDMLNGRPIQDWNFMTRAFNAVSPISLNLDKGPGRNLLFTSGYDLRLFAYTAPDGTKLTGHPEIRSKFQRQIGTYNLEKQLNELANTPRIQASLAKMEQDQRNGDFSLNPMSAYYHNKVIGHLLRQTAKRAWGDLRGDPEIQQLQEEARQLLRSNRTSLHQTRTLLSYPK